MSKNRYLTVDYRINSCMAGGRSYQVTSGESDFDQALLEEIHNTIRQTPGKAYMEVQGHPMEKKLWMVPFRMGENQLDGLLDAMDMVMLQHLGTSGFCFPVDVVSGENGLAYLMRPMERDDTKPLRVFTPTTDPIRWKIAISLFQRVEQLKTMGLTSNGISREQIRCNGQTGEVTIWMNETMTLLEDSARDEVRGHMGFLSFPERTQSRCQELGIAVDGGMRDIFSAAVAAFYLLMYAHPFIGCEFFSRIRQEYLAFYQNQPLFVMEPGTTNHPGNQILSVLSKNQWEKTVPELKELFETLFLAVTNPGKYWVNLDGCWDAARWIAALEADEQKNNNADSVPAHDFSNEWYHLV
jgi:hypothetical protein